MCDKDATSIPPQTFVECGKCKGNVNISWFCKNCPASLCDPCATAHKTIHQYRSHAVVPRTYTVLRLYGPAKLAEQCHIHPEKDISSFCNDCGTPCCVTCMVNDHKRHDFSTIEDKYLDAEKGLNKYYRQLDTDVRPTLEKMEEKARTHVQEDGSHAEKVINEINNFRKDVVHYFNRACDDLIVEVKQMPCKSTEVLKEIENSMKKLEALKNETEEKIARGNLDIITYQPPKFETIVPTLDKPTVVVPIFKPASKVLDVIRESVGTIYTICLDIQKIRSFNSEIGVISMTTLGNNMAWVMHHNSPTMYLYNDEGKVVRTVKVGGTRGINDMTITQYGEMILTCVDNKVRRVSVSGEMSTLIDTAPFGCSGVCLTDKEEIVVCMNDQGYKNHVAVYSPDGRSKLREIRGRDGKGKYLLIKPYRVVQNCQDLCVVNIKNNVVCVDESDNVRWVYDGKQAKLGEPFSPRCICRDHYQNLLVTDIENHCVHYIHREGGLIRVVLTQEQIGLQYHWGICVDDVTRHVWVGAGLFKKNVVIAKYLD